MILMFILMVLPVIVIPAFWLLPLDRAIPLYLVSVLLSASMFWLMHRNHKIPVATGSEGLIDRDAEVISKSTLGVRTVYLVRTRGELWIARCDDIVEVGEIVRIVAIGGNTLTVKRKSGVGFRNLPENGAAHMMRVLGKLPGYGAQNLQAIPLGKGKERSSVIPVRYSYMGESKERSE